MKVMLVLLASIVGDSKNNGVEARLTDVGSGKTGVNVNEQKRRLVDDDLRQPYVVGVTSYNRAPGRHAAGVLASRQR